MDRPIEADMDRSTVLHPLILEALSDWKGTLSPRAWSARLSDAICRELVSPPSVKFIEDLRLHGEMVYFLCVIDRTLGHNDEFDAARIAIFRLINVRDVSFLKGNQKGHPSCFGVESFRSAAKMGINLSCLFSYLMECTNNRDSDTQAALHLLSSWCGHSLDNRLPDNTGNLHTTFPITHLVKRTHRLPSDATPATLESQRRVEPSIQKLSLNLGNLWGPTKRRQFDQSLRDAPAENSPEPTSLNPHSSFVPEQGRFNFQLQKLLKDQPLNILEKGVQAGVRFLDQVKSTLGSHESEEASLWLDRVEKIQKLVMKNRTVIGIVGNTGAGKSSVINAILEEER